MVNKKINKVINASLASVIILFSLLMLSIFTEFKTIMNNFMIILPLILILSISLIILSKQVRMKKERKRFLQLINLGAGGFVIFSILHNAFYALTVMVENNLILQGIMEGFHVVFFLISIILCPLIFLIGLIKMIIFYLNKK